MQSLSTTEAADATLSSLFEKAKAEPIVVKSGDADLGAIVSMKDYETLRRAQNDRVFAAMDSLGRQIRENAARQGISMEEVEQMLDRKAG